MARDLYHENVRRALEKDNWVITHDPYPIKIGVIRMFLDLGAERVIAAEKGNEKIAIEIKSFVGDSTISEFHEAMGQYGNYQVALEDEEPDRILFLAIPKQVYETFFQEPFIQKVVEKKVLNYSYMNLLQQNYYGKAN
ncbi:MAG: XisH family protein [Emticicia sp.]|nr:XisH family protein [Emticicia sp.]